MHDAAHQLIPAWIDGVLTPVAKLDVHHRGLKHPAVSVFVMRGQDILIQRRALTKYHTPGLWANTCCTHPLWGEAPGDCAIRRLEQELGITGLSPNFRDRVEYRTELGNGMTEHEDVDIFVVEAPTDLAVTANPDEVMDTRWIGIYDLAAETRRHPDRHTPWLTIYMDRHMGRIFGMADRV